MDGECRNADLAAMSNCNCDQVQSFRKPGNNRRPGNGQTSLVDILSGGGTSGRIANNPDEEEEEEFFGSEGRNACPEQHVNRYIEILFFVD